MERLNHLVWPGHTEFSAEDTLNEWQLVEALFEKEPNPSYIETQWILGLGMSAYIKLERFDDAIKLSERIRNHPEFLSGDPYLSEITNGQYGSLLIKAGRVEEGLDECLTIAARLGMGRKRGVPTLMCSALIFFIEEGVVDRENPKVQQIAAALDAYARKHGHKKLPQLEDLLRAVKATLEASVFRAAE